VEKGGGGGGADGDEVEELCHGPVPGFWECGVSNVFAHSSEKWTLEVVVCGRV